MESEQNSLNRPDQPTANELSESLELRLLAGTETSPSATENESALTLAPTESSQVLPEPVSVARPATVRDAKLMEPHPRQLALSTLLSLLVVLALIITIRFTVPPLVESIRYSWYRGQLRAEYEASTERLQQVALNSLSDVSQLVTRRVGPSVVHINLLATTAQNTDDSEGFFEQNPLGRALRGSFTPRSNQLIGQGSGVLLDDKGNILTNQHVIDGAGRVEVSLSDGRRITAERIGVDPLTDLAVIRISADGLLPITWGNSDAIDVGSPVWAVGSPFGLERTVTFGILSSKHRLDLKGTRYESRVSSTTTYGDLMQSDVAVNPGNSGGPLVNSSGEVIGINTAIVGETYMGVSFSIPSGVARRVADGLIKDGAVARGWLGVALSTDQVPDPDGASSPRRGALVNGWAQNDFSPAKAAGIQPGDLIISFNGQDISSDAALKNLIAQCEIGTKVKIEVLRDGVKQSFDVEIGRRPATMNVR